ncbi:MAG: Coq4 family protein, partial [Myxococcota bacterium]
LRHVPPLPTGKEMLAGVDPLFEVLQYLYYLTGLPAARLGRTYADWTAREQISAAGLKAESDAAARTETEIDGPYAAMNGRLRDSHDLVHVVSGYGRDLVGEIGVLAFTFGNSGHRGLGLLALIGFLRSMLPDPDQPMASRAFRRAVRGQFFAALRAGRRADFIVGADWEALLPLPLDEVRARFGIEPAAGYVEVRSAGAPDLETGLAAS